MYNISRIGNLEINFIPNKHNSFLVTVSLPSIRKILETTCSRKTIKYIPQNALSLNILFIELLYSDDRL